MTHKKIQSIIRYCLYLRNNHSSTAATLLCGKERARLQNRHCKTPAQTCFSKFELRNHHSKCNCSGGDGNSDPDMLTDQHKHEFLRTVLRLPARNCHPLRHKYERKKEKV